MRVEGRSMKMALSSLAVLAATILVVVPACMDRYMESVGEIAFGPNDPPGPLPNPNDWPMPLQDLQQELGGGTKIDGYLLYGAPGEYSVKSAVFRIATPASSLSRIVDRLELVSVSSTHKKLDGWGEDIVSKASTEWWPSSPGLDADSVDYYVSQGQLDGDEDSLYTAVFDEDHEVLQDWFPVMEVLEKYRDALRRVVAHWLDDRLRP